MVVGALGYLAARYDMVAGVLGYLVASYDTTAGFFRISCSKI